MKILFLTSLVLLAYAYVGYPALLWLLAESRGRRWQSGDALPGVTIVVAAHQEVAVIREKLENFLAIDYPRERLEMLVVSDASSDGTDDIVREFADSGVRLLRQEPRQGKPAALGLALEHVTSEVVVFTDANVLLAEDSLRHLVRPFADEDVTLVTGTVQLVDRKPGYAHGEGAYYRYERFLQRSEAIYWSVVGVDGALYAARRERIAPPPKQAIIDDFVLSMEAVKRSGRIVYVPEARAYEDAAGTLAEEFRRKMRVAAGAFQSMRMGWGIPTPGAPRLLLCYLSHKVMRWLGPCFLLALLASNLAMAPESMAWALLLALQLAFYALAVAGLLWPRLRAFRPVALAMYFVLMNAAFASGFALLAAGRANVRWAPVARTRVELPRS